MQQEGVSMDQFAILAILQARPGKENDVEEFLKSARVLVLQETGTLSWFAVRLGSARFAIFDTFPDAAGRDAHLNGEIARGLFARAEELFSTPPQVEQGAILASKTPRS
jgi:quinol monooxygenase YgiN